MTPSSTARRALHLTLWACVGAAPPVLARPVRAGAQTVTAGRVEGRVVQQESGQPLANVTIGVLNLPNQATTRADGTFRLTGLPAGRQTLTVARIGYARQLVPVEVRAGQVASVAVQLAQTASRLEQVVVSTERQERAQVEIPYSISAVSATQLTETRSLTPAGLSGRLPNVVISNFGYSALNNITIRGVNSFAGNAFEPAVATYIDGVYQPDIAGTNFEFRDVDRVEVLRGPQGTLYGRGAMGGVISVVTRAPTNVTQGFASVEGGNYGQARYRAGASGALVPDQLFAEADGFYRSRGGYITDTLRNAALDSRRSFGGGGRLRYVAGPRWNFDLTGNLQSNRDRGVAALSPNEAAAFAKPYRTALNEANVETNQLYTGAFTARYLGPSVEFTSATGYSRIARATAAQDADFTAAPLVVARYGVSGPAAPGIHNTVWSEELRAAHRATAELPLSWQVGAYGFTQTNPTYLELDYAAAISPTKAPLTTLQTTENKAKGYALFGQGTYTLAGQFDLTGGLRFERQTSDVASATSVIAPGAPLTAPVSVGKTSSAVTGRASVAWRPNGQTNLYATYARGFRPGGLTILAGTSSGRPYDPEYLDNYEAGVKYAAADGRLNLAAAAFLLKWKDQQVNAYNLQTFANNVLNAGRATNRGLEVEGSVLPVARLRIDASVGYLHARYDSLNLSLDPATPLLYSGNTLPNAPKFTSTLGAQYTVLLGAAGDAPELRLSGDVRSFSRQYFDLANQIVQGGYSLATAQLTLHTRPVDVSAWGQNLTNKRYLVYGVPFGGSNALLGEPRLVGVTLSRRW